MTNTSLFFLKSLFDLSNKLSKIYWDELKEINSKEQLKLSEIDDNYHRSLLLYNTIKEIEKTFDVNIEKSLKYIQLTSCCFVLKDKTITINIDHFTNQIKIHIWANGDKRSATDNGIEFAGSDFKNQIFVLKQLLNLNSYF